MTSKRLRALYDLSVPEIREFAGRHEYDGVVQDLSPESVTRMLKALGDGQPEPDAHDEAHLRAAEAGARAVFGLTDQHRWNPLLHLSNLDLACYDREYAPEDEREDARVRHLKGWPDAVESAIVALDRIPAPVATALAPAVAGLAAGLPAGDSAARASLERLVAHVRLAADTGPPEVALGSEHLAALFGDGEDLPVDLGRLEERCDAERSRLFGRLAEACDRHSPGAPVETVVAALLDDHPDEAGILSAAEALVVELGAFTREHDLLPELGGSCLVGPAPPSRSYAMAMMSWTGPFEKDAPARYYVNPPDPSFGAAEREEWLSVFSATTLPAITAHEVTPGHFAHGRMICLAARGEVRRSLFSLAFVEGWAHYAEELMVEEGFREGDPRFCIGVCVEALVRVTRLAAALGVHRSTMTLEEATGRFSRDAFLKGPAARSEATRSTFDPTYGRYTWGKLEIMKLRDEAIARWGGRFTHRRFNEALLELGAPPLGTMGDALEPG